MGIENLIVANDNIEPLPPKTEIVDCSNGDLLIVQTNYFSFGSVRSRCFYERGNNSPVKVIEEHIDVRGEIYQVIDRKDLYSSRSRASPQVQEIPESPTRQLP